MIHSMIKTMISSCVKAAINPDAATQAYGSNIWIDPPTTIGATWTDNGGGSYSRTNGPADEIESTIAVTNGDSYRVIATITGWSAGNLDVRVQSGTAVGLPASNGTHEITVVAGASGTTRLRAATFGTILTVSNIQIQKIL